MKFLVISDTHGSYEKAVDLINKGNYDAVIHLGDLVRDAEAIRERTGAWVIGVAGNMDGDFSDTKKL